MKIKLVNARLSFPSLFEATSFEGSKPSFKATFILDKKKDAAKIAEINKAIDAMIAEKWKGKVTRAKLKGVCLRDGEEKADMDGYGDDVMFISSASLKRIPVVDGDLSPLSAQDNKPYAGCYVNGTIELWVQDNDFGKRINAQLRAVQFSKNGDPFGVKEANPEEEFDKVEESADDVV